METRANYVLVGIFSVVILVLGFGFVWWSANVSGDSTQTPLLVRIEGSVTGLSVGSQVLFNGLKVGDVRNLRIDPNDPRVVIATTQVDGTTPITTSTRATIGFAGLTGQAFIELKGGDNTERNIIAYAREQGAVPVIKADPSDVTDILATAKDIAQRADNILSQFEGMVKDVGPAVRTTADNITATSENVKVFTDSLAKNSGQIDDFLKSVSRLAGTANTVAEALPDAIRSAQQVIEAVNPESVRITVDNVAAMSTTLRAQAENIGGVVDSVKSAAASVGRVGDTIQKNTPGIDRFLSNLGPISDTATSVATKLDSALGSADTILAAVNPSDVSATIGNISAAARNVSEVSTLIGEQREAIGEVITNVSGVTRNLKTVTDSVAKNGGAIDGFLASLGPIGENASEASAKLNRTLDDARLLVAGIDRQRISQVVDDVAAVVSGVRARTPQIQSVISGLDTTLRTVDTTLNGFNGTRARVDDILAAVDPDIVNRTMTNVSSATRDVARAADSIAGVANDIGSRREDIDRVIDNAVAISSKVNTASTRLDTVLASLDRLLNAESTEGLAKEASQTLAAIRQTAANINSRIGPIADNIQNFSGNGLNEVRALVRDVTRSVTRIEGAVTDFQANPSRLIFGGDEVKQFDGRRRR